MPSESSMPSLVVSHNHLSWSLLFDLTCYPLWKCKDKHTATKVLFQALINQYLRCLFSINQTKSLVKIMIKFIVCAFCCFLLEVLFSTFTHTLDHFYKSYMLLMMQDCRKIDMLLLFNYIIVWEEQETEGKFYNKRKKNREMKLG